MVYLDWATLGALPAPSASNYIFHGAFATVWRSVIRSRRGERVRNFDFGKTFSHIYCQIAVLASAIAYEGTLKNFRPKWNRVCVTGNSQRYNRRNIINDNGICNARARNERNDKTYRSIHLFFGALIWLRIPQKSPSAAFADAHTRARVFEAKKSATKRRNEMKFTQKKDEKRKSDREYKWSVFKAAKHATKWGGRCRMCELSAMCVCVCLCETVWWKRNQKEIPKIH